MFKTACLSACRDISESSTDISPNAVFETVTGKLDLMNAEQSSNSFFKIPGNVKIEKIFTFDPAGYTIAMEVKVHNLTSSPITQVPTINWYQYVDPGKVDDSYGHEGPAVSVGGSIERQEVKKLNGESIMGPNVLWSAYESKYFIASLIPENPSLTNVVMTRDETNMVSVGTKGRKEVIPAGKTVLFRILCISVPSNMIFSEHLVSAWRTPSILAGLNGWRSLLCIFSTSCSALFIITALRLLF